jgi:hypothetical protein
VAARVGGGAGRWLGATTDEAAAGAAAVSASAMFSVTTSFAAPSLT